MHGRITGKNKGYEDLPLEIVVERIRPQDLFSYRWHPNAHDLTVDYTGESMTLVEFHLAESAGTTTLIVVRGADGEAEYGAAFARQVEAWKKAAAKAGAKAIVIGGGLTAIDTATELLAYYPVQVLKVLDKYEKLIPELGTEKFWNLYDDEEKSVIETFIEHAKEIKVDAKQNNQKNN